MDTPSRGSRNHPAAIKMGTHPVPGKWPNEKNRIGDRRMAGRLRPWRLEERAQKTTAPPSPLVPDSWQRLGADLGE
jgi:hypothetical protein